MGSRSDEQTITSHTVRSTSPMVAPPPPGGGPAFPRSRPGSTLVPSRGAPRSHYWSRPSTWRRRVPIGHLPRLFVKKVPSQCCRSSAPKRPRCSHLSAVWRRFACPSVRGYSPSTPIVLTFCQGCQPLASGRYAGVSWLRPKGRKVSAGITCSLKAADAVGIEPNFLGLPR